MRSFKSARDGPVALAALAEPEAEFVLDLGRRLSRQRLFEPSFERDQGEREGASSPRAARIVSISVARRASASTRAAAIAVPASAICSSSPSNKAREPSRSWNSRFRWRIARS